MRDDAKTVLGPDSYFDSNHPTCVVNIQDILWLSFICNNSELPNYGQSHKNYESYERNLKNDMHSGHT